MAYLDLEGNYVKEKDVYNASESLTTRLSGMDSSITTLSNKLVCVKLGNGGNYADGSYQTLSENPKNFLLVAIIMAGADGNYFYQRNTLVIPTSAIVFASSASPENTTGITYDSGVWQSTSVYASGKWFFYNSGSTYRLYLHHEKMAGWSYLGCAGVYGIIRK